MNKQFNWNYNILNGTNFSTINGNFVTKNDNRDCPDYWFSGESTIVLGGTKIYKQNKKKETIGKWEFCIDRPYLKNSIICYLAIGCIRYFGGLHSKIFDSRIDIYLNKNQVDGFALRIIPENHSDYFHRIKEFELPKIPKLEECKTIYSWSINKDYFNDSQDQIFEIRIDKDVIWDIDYLGFAIKYKIMKPKIFLSHSWNDKPVARLLAEKLLEKGIKVWLDEAEIKLGDSLVEKIREGIDNVEYVIALLSKYSINSEWVKKELDIAMNQEISGKKVKVLPIILDDSELPGFLLGKLYANLTSLDNIDNVIKMVEDRIGENGM